MIVPPSSAPTYRRLCDSRGSLRPTCPTWSEPARGGSKKPVRRCPFRSQTRAGPRTRPSPGTATLSEAVTVLGVLTAEAAEEAASNQPSTINSQQTTVKAQGAARSMPKASGEWQPAVSS